MAKKTKNNYDWDVSPEEQMEIANSIPLEVDENNYMSFDSEEEKSEDGICETFEKDLFTGFDFNFNVQMPGKEKKEKPVKINRETVVPLKDILPKNEEVQVNTIPEIVNDKEDIIEEPECITNVPTINEMYDNTVDASTLSEDEEEDDNAFDKKHKELLKNNPGINIEYIEDMERLVIHDGLVDSPFYIPSVELTDDIDDGIEIDSDMVIDTIETLFRTIVLRSHPMAILNQSDFNQVIKSVGIVHVDLERFMFFRKEREDDKEEDMILCYYVKPGTREKINEIISVFGDDKESIRFMISLFNSRNTMHSCCVVESDNYLDRYFENHNKIEEFFTILCNDAETEAEDDELGLSTEDIDEFLDIQDAKTYYINTLEMINVLIGDDDEDDDDEDDEEFMNSIFGESESSDDEEYEGTLVGDPLENKFTVVKPEPEYKHELTAEPVHREVIKEIEPDTAMPVEAESGKPVEVIPTVKPTYKEVLPEVPVVAKEEVKVEEVKTVQPEPAPVIPVVEKSPVQHEASSDDNELPTSFAVVRKKRV